MKNKRLTIQLGIASIVMALAMAVHTESHENEESRWEATIQRFEEADKTNPPPKNAILFVGSSSIVFWRTLAEDMAPLPVINRGFGGSQMFELNQFRDRIVVPYEPRAVLVYEGDNDVASGKSPDEILAEYRDFVGHLQEKLPDADVFFIAVKPSVLRAHMWPTMVEVNERLQALADEHEHVQFLDTSSPLLTDEGKPDPDVLVADNLHMNAIGYARWTAVVKPVLVAKYGE